MFYTIYKTTNLITGKHYIGKHQTKNLTDGYMGSGKLLRRAMEKHGLENFHKEILFICKDEKHMNTLEKILVVIDEEISYNLCDGGKGGWGYLNRTGMNNSTKDMEKAKANISKALKGRKNPRLSEYNKERHRLGLVNYSTTAGRKLTEEHKKKISEARKRK